MKVYRLTADIDRKYAQIHSQMEQEPKEGITVMWDDWLVKGNIIPDFIFSVYSISKTKIIKDLQNRFNGLEKIKLLWEKNPKEEVAKNIHGNYKPKHAKTFDDLGNQTSKNDWEANHIPIME